MEVHGTDPIAQRPQNIGVGEMTEDQVKSVQFYVEKSVNTSDYKLLQISPLSTELTTY